MLGMSQRSLERVIVLVVPSLREAVLGGNRVKLLGGRRQCLSDEVLKTFGVLPAADQTGVELLQVRHLVRQILVFFQFPAVHSGQFIDMFQHIQVRLHAGQEGISPPLTSSALPAATS